ncbi:hypothetical protein [Sphingomonas xinjiangensis]|uniref:Uncharacterized protein n=1 Tax=Sphingomonas xinjiangensis TaxID=643568 RepID=A0A840YQ56_9SPHN|nr:hypothetical protein [Sphingomonas xinjiangensis]MBB5710502.1 hypothetical protein [Sphingomonas xinjiangensis]
MNGGAALLWLACGLGVAAVGVLRFAWSLPHRSAAWNSAGWAALAACVLCGGWSAGAWGVSVAALCTMAAAFAVLAVAGWRAPPGKATGSNRRMGMLPEPGEPHIGRRLVTFLLVMPGGLLAALAIALAVRGSGLALGWGEANANVGGLFAVPLAWGVLCTILLMQARRGQAITLLVCGVAGAPFIVGGMGA